MEGRRIYVKHPTYQSNELKHYNTPGSHWGQRLYQNKDGSLTPLGRIHYGIGQARVKRAERAAEKARAKAEKESERDRKRYQNRDGTLKLRGKLHYKTMDKYALLSDDDLRQQTTRLQLQKNYEDLKRQTSSVERIKSKLGSAVEDVTVSGFKRGAEKLVNSLVDKGVSKILNTDKEKAEKVREFTKQMADMKTNEIAAYNKRNKEFDEAYLRRFGEKPKQGFEYPDLTEEEKAGLRKSSNQQSEQKPKPEESKPEQKPSENKPKTEEPKSSEKKPEEKQTSEQKEEFSEKKPESKTEEAVNKSDKQNESNEEKAARAYDVDLTDYKSQNRKIRVRAYEKPETHEHKTNRAYGISQTEKGKVRKYENKAESVDKSRIKGLRSFGMTISEIAKKLGISTSTVEKYL